MTQTGGILPFVLALAPLLGCSATAQNPGSPPAFDGARAFADLKAIVDLGPRPAGSAAAAATRDYIRRQLDAVGLAVDEQRFDARTPVGTVPMVNLRVRLPGPSSGRRLLIGGHYDTKLFRDIRFVGANDGGSSTAFLIELARVLDARRLGVPVEIVFFDGEEAVVEWEGDDNTYGSRFYVEAARKDGRLREIGALVLVDMIGDRDLRIRREAFSTRWLTDIIWRHARARGRKEFVDEMTEVLDDHVPFLEAGVPAVDIIDFEYPPWHAADDTLDKVSAASLQVVGDVLLAALPDIAARLQDR